MKICVLIFKFLNYVCQVFIKCSGIIYYVMVFYVKYFLITAIDVEFNFMNSMFQMKCKNLRYINEQLYYLYFQC